MRYGRLKATAMPGLVVVLLAALLGGQATALHFEIVSIIQEPPTYEVQFSKTGLPGPVFPGGKYINPQAVLGGLVAFAYPGFVSQRVAGLPGWAFFGSSDGPYYSVDAEATPGARPTVEQMRLMMQSLLADRFGLRFHVETRTLPVRFLLIGPHGPKNITASAPGERYVLPRIVLDGGGIEARAAPMIDLADFLANIFHQPVIDRTGMKGTYDMEVKVGFDAGHYPISALRDTLKRLGLALVSGKAAVPVMVVDRVKRPSPN